MRVKTSETTYAILRYGPESDRLHFSPTYYYVLDDQISELVLIARERRRVENLLIVPGFPHHFIIIH